MVRGDFFCLRPQPMSMVAVMVTVVMVAIVIAVIILHSQIKTIDFFYVTPHSSSHFHVTSDILNRIGTNNQSATTRKVDWARRLGGEVTRRVCTPGMSRA